MSQFQFMPDSTTVARYTALDDVVVTVPQGQAGSLGFAGSSDGV